MHPSQTIPLLLVSFYPSHVHFILLAGRRSVLSPSRYRFQSARCPRPVFSHPSALTPRIPPFPVHPSVSRKRLFYISRWLDEETPARRAPVRIVWRRAILDRTYSEFFALPSRRKLSCSSPLGGARFPRAAAPVVYDYRRRKTMRAAWQTYASLGELASRIMLSTPYALRSATSAKSRREFYCGPRPVMRNKSGSS